MKVYLICPVRNVTVEQQVFADEYVASLEAQGHEVHYPPRDVDQRDDGIGFSIIDRHRRAMIECHEVHIFWDPDSKGSHFDFGMAWMLQLLKPLIIKCVNLPAKTEHKSFANVLRFLTERRNVIVEDENDGIDRS